MNISIEELNALIDNPYIIAESFRIHSKASEKYLDVIFAQPDGFRFQTSIPYFYRRTGLFIETPQDLVNYLWDIYPLFLKKNIETFIECEINRWNEQMKGKGITKGFFDKLLNLHWNSVKYDFPSNPNFASRIKDIKNLGYTLATDTNRQVVGKPKKDTHILLVPIPKGGFINYETISLKFKSKALKILNYTNVYELSSVNRHGLLIDHKFPEIRWDAKTSEKNIDEMPDEEIKQKFQLLDNQRNQQKREVCRKCFQTGKRGKLYGLNYFYHGSEDWSPEIPKVGKKAEKGCIGCGWYDIQAWRSSLNKLVSENLK